MERTIQYIEGIYYQQNWCGLLEISIHQQSIVKLIIDCGQLKELQSVKDLNLFYVEGLSRNLCFILHTERLKKLNEG